MLKKLFEALKITRKKEEDQIIEIGDLNRVDPNLFKDASNRELLKVTKKVREVVTKIDPYRGSLYYNDPIKDGRSLKWYGQDLAPKLRKSVKFDRVVNELRDEGYKVVVKTTKGSPASYRWGATRVHIKRRSSK